MNASGKVRCAVKPQIDDSSPKTSRLDQVVPEDRKSASGIDHDFFGLETQVAKVGEEPVWTVA